MSSNDRYFEKQWESFVDVIFPRKTNNKLKFLGKFMCFNTGFIFKEASTSRPGGDQRIAKQFQCFRGIVFYNRLTLKFKPLQLKAVKHDRP